MELDEEYLEEYTRTLHKAFTIRKEGTDWMKRKECKKSESMDIMSV